MSAVEGSGGRRILAAWIFLYSFTVPLETLRLGSLPSSVAVYPAMGFLVTLGLHTLNTRGALPAPPQTPWFWGFGLWCALTVTWTVDPAESVPWLVTMGLTLVLTLAIMVCLVAYPELRRVAFTGYVIGATIVAVKLIQAERTGQFAVKYDPRTSALSQDPNMLAIVVVLAIPMALAVRGGVQSRAARAALLLVVPALTLGALTTGSRTGLIALLWVVVAQFALTRSATRWFLGAAVVWVSWNYLPDLLNASIFSRLATARGALLAGDLNFRQQIWRWSWGLFKERTLQGWGAGAFPSALKQSIGSAFASHNVFIGAAVETGIVGLFLLVGLLFVAYRPALRVEGHVWRGVLGAWLVGAATLTLTNEKITWWLVAVAASYAGASGPSFGRRAEPSAEVSGEVAERPRVRTQSRR